MPTPTEITDILAGAARALVLACHTINNSTGILRKYGPLTHHPRKTGIYNLIACTSTALDDLAIALEPPIPSTPKPRKEKTKCPLPEAPPLPLA